MTYVWIGVFIGVSIALMLGWIWLVERERH